MVENDVYIKVGTAIRDERKKKGMSQEAFAFKCGLHRTYIGSVERGERNISLKNLQIISQALDITLSELIKISGT